MRRNEAFRYFAGVIPVIHAEHEEGLRVADVDGEEVVVEVAVFGVLLFVAVAVVVLHRCGRRGWERGGVYGDDLASCAAQR